MNKPFKKLKGNRVYIKYIPEAKTDIIMSAEAKEELLQERIKRMYRLKVYAVGDAVTDPDIKEGCEVMIDPSALMRKPVLFEIEEGVEVFCVNVLDISHIW